MPTPLYLTEDDVNGLVSMTDALPAVEQAFRNHEFGAKNEPRRRLAVKGGMLHVMFAVDPACGFMGLKSYTTFRDGVRFHVLLYSTKDGSLLAMIEANRLGQLRTGAASGVATRALSRPESSVAAVFGTGFQAETQVEALAHVRTLHEVRIYGRDPQRRKEFSARLSARLGVWVLPVDSPDAAVDGADIVATATTSATPVFNGDRLAPGAHVNAAGSNSLKKREIDTATLVRAGLIAVDDFGAAELEGGDLTPINEGLVSLEKLRSLSRILTGEEVGRTSGEEITVFKSHGIALEDIALAAVVYRKAVERGVGRPLGG